MKTRDSGMPPEGYRARLAIVMKALRRAGDARPQEAAE